MTNKTFTVVGKSNLYGKVKFRFANGSAKARTMKLVRSGHVDIDLLELPEAMTKDEAKAYYEGALARSAESTAA